MADATTATVNQGSTVVLPTIRVIGVDSDDTLTLTIVGLPTGATITDSADSKVFSGSSFTLTGAEVGSTLTLHDGSNSGNFTLNVTAQQHNDRRGSKFGDANAGGDGEPQCRVQLVRVAARLIWRWRSPAANGAPVTVTITGVPSDWQLQPGNNTWATAPGRYRLNDLTTLTVLTAAWLCWSGRARCH